MGLFAFFTSRKKWRLVEKDIKLHENDMYFFKGEACKSERALPNGYANYSFAPDYSGDESTTDFYFLAKYIMEKLFEPYYTITSICDYNFKNTCSYKKNRVCDKLRSFTSRYYEFLCAHDMDENVFSDCTEQLFILDKGLNKPITRLTIECTEDDDTPKEGCFYSVYAYKTQPIIKTFSDAKKISVNATYDIYMCYSKYPDYLEFVINEQTVDVNGIIKFAREASEKYGKKFFSDREL